MLQKFVKSVSGGAAAAPGLVLSVIGPDVRIVGDIISKGEVQVDGQVDGDIACVTLVVGEGARICGEITADHVKVHGELSGKINATVICIARSARVIGDVTHESLEIEAGAHVEGHCIRKAPGVPKVEPKRIEAVPPQAPAPAGKGANGSQPPQQAAAG